MKFKFRSTDVILSIVVLVLLIVYLIFKSDLGQSQRLSNILTPFFSLITGVIIFYSLIESRKVTKEMTKSNNREMSVMVYNDMLETLNKREENEKLIFSNIPDHIQNKITQLVTTELLETSIEFSNITNRQWYSFVRKLTDRIKIYDPYYEIMNEFHTNKLSIEKFDEHPMSDLYIILDYSLIKIRNYYGMLQNTLYDLATNKYDDLRLYERNKVIYQIMVEAGYNDFLSIIEPYFQEDKIRIRNNVPIIIKKINEEGTSYEFEKRLLIQWYELIDLYSTHQVIKKILNKEVDEIKRKESKNHS